MMTHWEIFLYVQEKTPLINDRASTLLELIDSSEGVYEPPLTCKLTTVEIRKLIDEPMQVPQWSCHAQSIERCVKQVTEAANRVRTLRVISEAMKQVCDWCQK
uniref:Uncharacterized protein n=1 Tax=Micrurus paraensis TaxID=1970185 RepID=A0A2D4JYV2_9SAUR